ncbi:MAG: ParA family protein [Methylotenera sp.]
MKTLYIGIQKGGVGKSTQTCQLAFYARSQGYRVLVIDFDDQANTTHCLARSGKVTPLSKTVTEVMMQPVSIIPDNSGFNILAADGHFNSVLVEQARVKVEVDGIQTELASLAHQHFAQFLESMDAHYDLCIIDGPPSLDIRVTIALTLADAVLSPIELMQESIEGMSNTLYGQRGILNIKSLLNPKLQFLGFLPNKVQSNDTQRAALKELNERIGQHFFINNEGVVALISLRSAISECQKQGISLADIVKTNTMARSTWASLRKIFDLILARIGVEDQVQVEHDQVESGKTEPETGERVADNVIDLAAQKAKVGGQLG